MIRFIIVRHGFARGYETLQFVDNIRNYLDMLDRLAPRDAPLVPRVHETAQSSSKSAGLPR